ncbi:MAG: hypothetical protein IE916_01540 [Epsilonproteobacteria bacterium]|nr:hypothetical protein [Campylobacterota bacterium]
MKNAYEIIQSLQNEPQFSKLKTARCLGTIKSLFNHRLQTMIKFAYLKNGTIFFVLTHPGAKQEFDNSIDSIKSALKFHMPQECAELSFKELKAFVTHSPRKVITAQSDEPRRYKERSTGAFENSVKDPKLHALIGTIQKIIKEMQ